MDAGAKPQWTTTRWPVRRNHDWSARARVDGRRLQTAWAEFVGRVPWDVFVTLTFDPDKVFPVGSELASREAFDWLGHVGRCVRSPVAWVFAPERGRGGCWHAHALIAGADVRAIEPAAAYWQSRNGKIDVRATYDARGATLYTSKDAALSGEIVLSDTLLRYKGCLGPAAPSVRLFPK